MQTTQKPVPVTATPLPGADSGAGRPIQQCSRNAKRQEDGGAVLRRGGVGNTEELAFAPCTPSLTLPLPLAVYCRIIFPISQVKKVRHHWGKLPKSAGYCRKRWGRLAAELTAIGRASSEEYSLPTGASLYQKHPTVRVSVYGMCGGQVGSVASCKHVSVYPYN